MRKFFSLLLCLALIISLAAMPALAEGPEASASQTAEVTVEGTTYTVGFYTTDDSGYTVFGGDSGGWGTNADWNYDENAEFFQQWALNIGAFTQTGTNEDNIPVYTLASDINVTVNSMAISGTTSVFSFSDGAEPVLTYTGAAEWLYWRTGNPGSATVSASVTVGEAAEPVTVYLRVTAHASEEPQFAFYTSPNGGEANKIAYDGRICYHALEEESLWLIADNEFTGVLDEINVRIDNQLVALTWDNNNTAGIKLPDPGDENSYIVSADYDRQSCFVTVRDWLDSTAVEYNGVTVGFDGGDAIADSGSWFYTSDRSGPGENYVAIVENKSIIARKSDGSGADVDIEVKGMTLVTVKSDAENALSFSSSEVKTYTEDEAVTVYCLDGCEAMGYVRADITIDGHDATVTLAVECRRTGIKFYTTETPDEASRVTRDNPASYYSLETPGTLWAVSDTGFDAGRLNIWVRGQRWSDYEVSAYNSKIRIFNLPDPENGSYSVNINNGADSASVEIYDGMQGNGIEIEHNGEDYLIGFSFEDEGGVVTIDDGTWNFGTFFTGEENPDNERFEFRDMEVIAGRRERDENGVEYYVIDGVCRPVVRSAVITPVYGDGADYKNAFSFSPDKGEAVLSIGEGQINSNTVTVYAKSGYDCSALLTAAVDVYIGGSLVTTGKVTSKITLSRIYGADMVRPEGDTVAALNADLADEVENLPEGEQGIINIVLVDGEYVGEIVIPESLAGRGNYEIHMRPADGGRTTIAGGIDLNGAQAVISDVDFIAPESSSGETCAIQDGFCGPWGCTFQGYDVALYATFGTMCPQYCVFADNGVAMLVDIENARDQNRNSMVGNVFINNGTAVQVLSLSNFVSPYYFRIYECNFVNNRVTFDVSCSGTLYLYRNYYGESLNNMTSAEIFEEIQKNLGSQIFNTIINCPPTVNAGGSGQTRVITNPRWIFPYFDPTQLYPDLPRTYDGMRMLTFSSVAPLSLSGMAPLSLTADEQEEENYLTADWDRPTEIIDTESANLMIDDGAFDKETEEDRIITVVGQQGTTLLGTWNLGKAAHEGLEGSFDASLSVVRGADGVITVTVNADTALLTALKPTLTIPDAAGGVRYGDDVLKSIEEDGSVKFTVEAGGVYVISEDISESPEEPEPPEDPEDPGTPEDPETPGEPAVPNVPHVPETPDTPAAPDGAEMPFADVASGDWFYDAVEYTYTNGLMDGVSTTEFNPNGTMTRAMLWTILARIDGQTVTGGSWIETARAWAMAEGVSDGENANGLVTREQFATMLWRYVGEPESDYTLSTYTDAASVSSYALDAMRWAVENGIITGVSATTIVPQGTATRAQAAAMLMRFIENIV